MKKTLAAVLFSILAVAVIGYGIFAIADNNKSLDIETQKNNKTDKPSSSKHTFSDVFDFTESTDTPVTEETDLSETKAPVTEAPSAPEKQDAADGYAYAYAGFMPAYADMNVSDWRMILVNRDYILPDGYKPELENAVDGGYGDVYLDERVAPYYNKMYKAAYEDGIHLVPISGYRSVERQKNNFERKIDTFIDAGYGKVEATQKAATIILPPGTSEHNAGLAMDICSLEQNFEDTKEFEWLCENAADYGFILRYPEDKQDITKIIYEPWHWRYVGVEAAKEMKASGECLEEYLGVA